VISLYELRAHPGWPLHSSAAPYSVILLGLVIGLSF